MSRASYPIYLSLANTTLLIIGFGKVGQRKLKTLLDYGASKILVLDLKPLEQLDENARNLLLSEKTDYQNRAWQPGDIDECFIVFACTNNLEENNLISEYCKKVKKLCNNVTTPQNGNFIVPASIRMNDLAVAISSAGNSPAFISKLKAKIYPILENYDKFSNFMGKARQIIKNCNQNTQERQMFLKQLTSSEFINHFLAKDFIYCKKWININFPEAMANGLTEIINYY